MPPRPGRRHRLRQRLRRVHLVHRDVGERAIGGIRGGDRRRPRRRRPGRARQLGVDRAVLACWSLGVNVGFELAAVARPGRRDHGRRRCPGRDLRRHGRPAGNPPAASPCRRCDRSPHRAARCSPLGWVARHVPLTHLTATVMNHSGFLLPMASPDRLIPALEEFREHASLVLYVTSPPRTTLRWTRRSSGSRWPLVAAGTTSSRRCTRSAAPPRGDPGRRADGAAGITLATGVPGRAAAALHALARRVSLPAHGQRRQPLAEQLPRGPGGRRPPSRRSPSSPRRPAGRAHRALTSCTSSATASGWLGDRRLDRRDELVLARHLPAVRSSITASMSPSPASTASTTWRASLFVGVPSSSRRADPHHLGRPDRERRRRRRRARWRARRGSRATSPSPSSAEAPAAMLVGDQVEDRRRSSSARCRPGVKPCRLGEAPPGVRSVAPAATPASARPGRARAAPAGPGRARGSYR